MKILIALLICPRPVEALLPITVLVLAVVAVIQVPLVVEVTVVALDPSVPAELIQWMDPNVDQWERNVIKI